MDIDFDEKSLVNELDQLKSYFGWFWFGEIVMICQIYQTPQLNYLLICSMWLHKTVHCWFIYST